MSSGVRYVHACMHAYLDEDPGDERWGEAVGNGVSRCHSLGKARPGNAPAESTRAARMSGCGKGVGGYVDGGELQGTVGNARGAPLLDSREEIVGD